MKFCSTCIYKSENDNSEDVDHSVQTELVIFKTHLPGIDEYKRKVLKQFDQSHLLEGYAKLGKKQQEKLLTDLELIHFDFIDLVFHNLIKKNRAKISVDPSSLTPIKSEAFIQPNQTREAFEDTLKLVSEGKLCFVVTTGLTRKVKGDSQPKLLYVPDWDSELSLLEALLRRAKEIGQTAVKTYGKNFTKKREPILVYLMVNTAEMMQLQQLLGANKHFGYAGIVTFGQEVLPYINEQGKMVFADESRDRIRLVSNGCGGLLSALKPQGVLDHLISNGVEVLQLFDLNNLTIPLAEPQFVQEATKSDIVLQLNWTDPRETSLLNPTVYFNQRSQLYEYLNQREVQFVRKAAGNKLLTVYEMKSLNLYLNIELLKQAAKSSDLLYEYRVKDQININKHGRESFMSGEAVAEESMYFSFELHFLNVLKITKNVKFFLLSDNQDVTVQRIQTAGWVPNLFMKELDAKLPEILSFVTPVRYNQQIKALPLGKKLELFLLTSYCYDEHRFEAFLSQLKK